MQKNEPINKVLPRRSFYSRTTRKDARTALEATAFTAIEAGVLYGGYSVLNHLTHGQHKLGIAVVGGLMTAIIQGFVAINAICSFEPRPVESAIFALSLAPFTGVRYGTRALIRGGKETIVGLSR